MRLMNATLLIVVGVLILYVFAQEQRAACVKTAWACLMGGSK